MVTNQITINNQNLPSKREDLEKFVLIGRHQLAAVKTAIKTIDRIGLAKDVYKQKVAEGQDMAEAILDAEVRLGEIFASLPTNLGARTDVKPRSTDETRLQTKEQTLKEDGFSKATANRLEQLHKHPEAVKRAKDKAREKGELVSRAAVEKEIRTEKNAFIKKEIDDKFSVDLNKEIVVKNGDLWVLGEHRLFCGDANDFASYAKVSDGYIIDLVLTDPPYGIDSNNMTLGAGKKEFYRGDDWDKAKAYVEVLFSLDDAIKTSKDLKYCIWGGNYYTDILPVTNDWLCWHKKNDGRSFSEFELAWTNFGKNCRIMQHHWGNEEKLHPTMKPVSLMYWCLEQCDNASTVLDPYAGSGTTLIACEHNGKRCLAIEKDPKYCEIIIGRWEELTGKKAYLKNGGKDE